MGWRVRVSLRLEWQGKNVSLNIITMGTSVGSHKGTTQEENNYHKEAWVWEGVLGLALALTLDLCLSRVSLDTVCCPLSIMSFVLGPLSITLFLLPLAWSPPSPTSQPHGPTSCLSLVLISWVTCKFWGPSLLSPSWLLLEPELNSFLFLFLESSQAYVSLNQTPFCYERRRNRVMDNGPRQQTVSRETLDRHRSRVRARARPSTPSHTQASLW